MIKDTKLTELLTVPRSTIQDWKHRDKYNWRFKVYNFLKKQDEETIKKFLEELEKK